MFERIGNSKQMNQRLKSLAPRPPQTHHSITPSLHHSIAPPLRIAEGCFGVSAPRRPTQTQSSTNSEQFRAIPTKRHLRKVFPPQNSSLQSLFDNLNSVTPIGVRLWLGVPVGPQGR